MQWTTQRANEWYAKQTWPVGFNYVPSTAVNSTEMWQAETYDGATIAQELALAARAGFNSCRVFLPFVVWEAERGGFLRRFDEFLSCAAGNGISVMPVLFDDCAFSGREPHIGPQAPPVAGVHNSGWTASPGSAAADDPAKEELLEAYVKNVIGTYADDARVLVWDLYNETGNNSREAACLPLLEKAFAWAREVNPSQPLTACAWAFQEYDLRAAALSDVVSYHDYQPMEGSEEYIARLKPYNRSMLCTEWLHRAGGNGFESHLPLYRREKIGAYNWGLVVGKTQTNLSWDTMTTPNPDPNPDTVEWQHDLFRADGTPYDAREIAFLQKMLSAEDTEKGL